MAVINEITRVSTEGEGLEWFAVCLSCGIQHLTEGVGETGKRNAWMEVREHVNKGLWTHDTKVVRRDVISLLNNQKLRNEILDGGEKRHNQDQLFR